MPYGDPPLELRLAVLANLPPATATRHTMQRPRLALFLAMATLSASAHAVVQAPATTWSLAGDYQVQQNPNGAWQYGQMVGGSFQALAWNPTWSAYGAPFVGGFVYQRSAPGTDFGIGSGQVSLESDWGTAAVRWTAPAAGSYAFSVEIGGSLMSGQGGFGNNFALLSQVLVDGVSVAPSSSVDGANGTFKLQTWQFTRALQAGATVDTFVVNPGYAMGGNTQTLIGITAAVPEPATAVLLLTGALVLGGLARRKAR